MYHPNNIVICTIIIIMLNLKTKKREVFGKKLKSLKNDNKGNANVIIAAILTMVVGFGMLTIGSYLYFSIAINKYSFSL